MESHSYGYYLHNTSNKVSVGIMQILYVGLWDNVLLLYYTLSMGGSNIFSNVKFCHIRPSTSFLKMIKRKLKKKKTGKKNLQVIRWDFGMKGENDMILCMSGLIK